MPAPAKPPRPTLVTVLAMISLWNGVGGLIFGLMGFVPATFLADMLAFSCPVPSWVNAVAKAGPEVNYGIWAALCIVQTVTGLGLWKLKNWARWIVIAQLVLFLVVPSLGSLAFGPRYYFTFPSFWARLLFDGAFLLVGAFLLRYLLSPPILAAFHRQLGASS